MRTLAVAVTASLALLVASSAGAVATLDFVWTGTSGSGTTGSSSIDAQIGDTLTLDILVSSESLLGAGVSVVWDASIAEATSATECPSPPNLAPGLCSIGANFFSPLAPGVVVDNATGQISSFDAYKTPPGVNGQLTLGRIVFTVEGYGSIDSFYIPGLDSLNDLDGSGVWFDSASATIVPEPSTMGLLALGLGALGMVGRRRN